MEIKAEDLEDAEEPEDGQAEAPTADGAAGEEAPQG